MSEVVKIPLSDKYEAAKTLRAQKAALWKLAGTLQAVEASVRVEERKSVLLAVFTPSGLFHVLQDRKSGKAHVFKLIPFSENAIPLSEVRAALDSLGYRELDKSELSDEQAEEIEWWRKLCGK